MAFYQEKLENWITDLKLCLEAVRTELEVLGKVNGWDPRKIKFVESSLLLYKQNIKDLIKQLRKNQQNPPATDQLDFLAQTKAQVQKLVSSIDKFTSTLGIVKSARPKSHRDSIDSPASKERTGFKEVGEGKHQGTAKKTGECKSAYAHHFEIDTFNTKFKRHMRAIEKSIHESGSKKLKSRGNSVDRVGMVVRKYSEDPQIQIWAKIPLEYGNGNSQAGTPRQANRLLRSEKVSKVKRPSSKTLPTEPAGDDSRFRAMESQLACMSELVKTQKAQIELLTREVGFLKQTNKSLAGKLANYEKNT